MPSLFKLYLQEQWYQAWQWLGSDSLLLSEHEICIPLTIALHHLSGFGSPSQLVAARDPLLPGREFNI
jgi:hypothetical protein